MIKFEIKKGNIEIPYENRNDIKPGCTCENITSEPELIESFEDLEDAKNSLTQYKTSIVELSSARGSYFSITEYFIEENQYDEDDNYVELEGVWAFSKMKISVCSTNGYKEISSYDNYLEASLAYEALEEQGYISFL